jgi:two-component system sensor histidine kinase YesM
MCFAKGWYYMLNFNSLSIRKQIFIALLTIVILTTILLGSIQYYFSSTSIRNEYQAAHVNAIEVANNVLEIQLRAIVDEQRTFLRNQHVTSLLRKNNKDEEGFSTFDNRILLNELQRTLFSNQAIRDIMLVSMQGNLIFTSQNDMNRRYISHYRNKDDILQEAWVRQCDAASGQEVFFHSNILFSSDKEDAFSVAKKLLDEKYEPLAYIVFNIRKSSLSAVFGKHNEGNETSDYMILDSSNLTEKDLPKLVYSSLPVSEKETDSIMLAFANQDTNKKYVFTGTKNAISKWEVVNVISQKELASRSSYVGKIGGVVALLVIGLSIPLSSVIARRITKPISILKQTMRNVESGNLRVDAEFDESEVGQLGQQFKHLVNNNLDLKDRLLKANLREREAGTITLAVTN